MSSPTPVALQIAGDLRAWRALGFAVDEDGRCPVGAVSLEVTDAAGLPPGLIGWTLTPGDGADSVDGIPTRWRPGTPPAAPTAHPNGALSVDHVVVATSDWWHTVGALQATGMLLRRERAAGPQDRPLRQGFFRHGECVVEVVGPQDPEPDGPPTRLWGVTLTVADLDAAAAMLGDRLGSIRDAVQPGRRIATVPREGGVGVPVALMSV